MEDPTPPLDTLGIGGLKALNQSNWSLRASKWKYTTYINWYSTYPVLYDWYYLHNPSLKMPLKARCPDMPRILATRDARTLCVPGPEVLLLVTPLPSWESHSRFWARYPDVCVMDPKRGPWRLSPINSSYGLRKGLSFTYPAIAALLAPMIVVKPGRTTTSLCLYWGGGASYFLDSGVPV